MTKTEADEILTREFATCEQTWREAVKNATALVTYYYTGDELERYRQARQRQLRLMEAGRYCGYGRE
jgi:hypothetical protein